MMQQLPWIGWSLFLCMSALASREIYVPLIPIHYKEDIYYASVKNIGEVDQTVTIDVIAHPRFEIDPKAWLVLYQINSYSNSQLAQMSTHEANAAQPGRDCQRYGSHYSNCFCANRNQSFPDLRGGVNKDVQFPDSELCVHGISLTCSSAQKCSQTKILNPLAQTHVQFAMNTKGASYPGESYYLYLKIGVQEDQGHVSGQVVIQTYHEFAQGGPLRKGFWEHGQFEMNGGRPF